MTIKLPLYLQKAIETYLDTDWKDGRDPSKIGALNAVAYIGEHVAALVREQRVANAKRKNRSARRR